MSNPNEIEVGDTVAVVFSYGGPDMFGGKVLYVPCATGDSWHIRQEDPHVATEGSLHYVQTFAEIVLVKKKEGL